MRALLIIISALICGAPASAIQLTMIGAGAPKVTVYKPCETQVIVYDARPEMGVSFELEKPAIGALDAIDVRMARVVLEMDTMEPTDKPGVYDSAYLDKWDKLVDECRARGVCLDVAIKGTQGKSEVTTTMIERLTRFTADMATRYPSVGYWEVGQNMNGYFSMLRSDLSPHQQGKICAQLLKFLYPAVKSANPAAQIVCLAWFDEFLKGVYEDGGRRFYDVALMRTGSDTFSATADGAKKAMSSNSDETKPLWCIYTDGFGQQKLEEAFHANNAGSLYQKIFVEKTGPVEDSKWLPGARVNSVITSRPSNSVNVFVATKKPMIPVGYDYKEVTGGIEIQRVMVDGVTPTVIQLKYAPEPQTVQPGEKPAPSKKKNRYDVDPWDI